MKRFAAIIISGLVLFVASCSKEDLLPIENPSNNFSNLNLPDVYFNYANISLPAHLTMNSFPAQIPFQYAAIAFDNTPNNNPITDAGATLGRVLFYDTKLSANGTIACASCHQQSHGFSDPKILSEGCDGGETGRHSMGIANARFYYSGKFFWDERAQTLEEQVLMPFQDPVEMGLTLARLDSIVTAQDYYAPLFEDAFGDPNITTERISRALAQFIRSMVSTTSPYDMARAEVNSPMVDFPAFSEQENLGKRLFFQPIPTTSGGRVNCSSCHATEAFVGALPNGNLGPSGATNNGLDANPNIDPGVFGATSIPNDLGRFKVPSLKNIATRPPYMHDGRFSTLEEVIQHYRNGIQDHPNLAAPLRDPNGNPVRLVLSQNDVNALVAFLETLTDEQMMSDEKFSNPFIE